MKVASKKAKQSLQGTPLFDYIDKMRESSSKTKVAKSKPYFPGPSYDLQLDGVRLSNLQWKVFDLMKDSKFRTHSEIKEIINQGSENGIAAMLRSFRHGSNGKHTVNKKRRDDPKRGLWEYQLVVNPNIRVKRTKES